MFSALILRNLFVGWYMVSEVLHHKLSGPGSEAQKYYLPKAFGVAPVRFGYGPGVGRFEQFRFSVLAAPLGRGVFLCFTRFGS